MSMMYPNETDPVPEDTEALFKAARASLADVVGQMYRPDPQGDYARLLPALRLDPETRKPRLRVRHIDPADAGKPVAEWRPVEEFLPLRPGAESLLAADGPDQQWVRARTTPPAPHIPSAEAIAHVKAEAAARELQYAWNDAAPLAREMLKLADVAEARDRRLLLALARVFSMKADEFIGTAGTPARCAAAFFSVDIKGGT